MIRYIKLCLYLIALCCIGHPIFADPANNADTSLTDLTKPIVLSAHKKEVVIRLQSNRTTGFSWFLAHYDRHALTPIAHTYRPPSNAKLIGAPGVEAFTFQIDSGLYTTPQTGIIQFVYKRPWEENPNSAKETSVHWISVPSN